jgi:hypothetical protein
MIMVYFNVRGVGGAPKLLTFKRFFKRLYSDVVLIHEIMCEASKACEVFLKVFPGWEFCAIGSQGLSGGLCVVWNLLFVDFKAFLCCARFLLEGRMI